MARLLHTKAATKASEREENLEREERKEEEEVFFSGVGVPVGIDGNDWRQTRRRR